MLEQLLHLLRGSLFCSGALYGEGTASREPERVIHLYCRCARIQPASILPSCKTPAAVSPEQRRPAGSAWPPRRCFTLMLGFFQAFSSSFFPEHNNSCTLVCLIFINKIPWVKTLLWLSLSCQGDSVAFSSFLMFPHTACKKCPEDECGIKSSLQNWRLWRYSTQLLVSYILVAKCNYSFFFYTKHCAYNIVLSFYIDLFKLFQRFFFSVSLCVYGTVTSAISSKIKAVF